MSETLDPFAKIIRMSERLDTPLVGQDYLDCEQKRYIDRFGAFALYLSTIPVVTAARAAVWAEDRGPTELQLPRVGKSGTLFGEYKIRTMYGGSELDDPNLGVKPLHDPRVLNIGRVLRELSIDELPQTKNILDGSMSLIGSRPKAPLQVEAYSEYDNDFYAAYTSMRPGLTGLEQISGRGATDIPERIELTKQYAAEASLKLDQDILRKTIKAVALRTGAY